MPTCDAIWHQWSFSHGEFINMDCLMLLQLDICGWIWYDNECNTIARKLELGSDFKLPEDTYISSVRVELREIFCEFIGEMWSRYIGSALWYHLYHPRYCLHRHFLILKCLILDWNFPCNFPLGNGHEALKLICKTHYVSPLGILYFGNTSFII